MAADRMVLVSFPYLNHGIKIVCFVLISFKITGVCGFTVKQQDGQE